MKKSILVLGMFSFALTGCGPAAMDFFKITDAQGSDNSSLSPTINGLGSDGSSGGSSSGGTNLTSASQSFSAASIGKKKIDMLFVVDNSGSMEQEQQAMAQGFSQVASQYFGNQNLDVCLQVITTDRYISRSNNNGYQKERFVGCTSPNGMSSAQHAAHSASIMTQFAQAVNVGIDGGNWELPGKSLVTFLADQNAWSNNLEPSATSHTSFFRQGSAKNISLVSDENNWYQYTSDGHCGYGESQNDLPPVTGAPKPSCASTQGPDNRKGMKNHVDSFLGLIETGNNPLYSVNSFYQTYYGINQRWSAMNLIGFAQAMGTMGQTSVIDASATVYASRYAGVMEELVNRASSFILDHAVAGSLTVVLSHSGGSSETLILNVDYTLGSDNRQVLLSQARQNALMVGDSVRIDYQF